MKHDDVKILVDGTDFVIVAETTDEPMQAENGKLLRAAGIEVAFPQRDPHVRSGAHTVRLEREAPAAS